MPLTPSLADFYAMVADSVLTTLMRRADRLWWHHRNHEEK
jgi:hypothetical protein